MELICAGATHIHMIWTMKKMLQPTHMPSAFIRRKQASSEIRTDYCTCWGNGASSETHRLSERVYHKNSPDGIPWSAILSSSSTHLGLPSRK